MLEGHICQISIKPGSKGPIREKTLKGLQEFIQVQKESPIDVDISIYSFNGSTVTTVIENKSAKEIDNVSNYNPRGMTNLLDAIGIVIKKVNEVVVNRSIDIAVITDGEENSSRLYNSSQIKELVKACEDRGWTFTFLGANIDSFAVGNTIGINNSSTMQFDVNNMAQTLSTMAYRSVAVRKGKLEGLTGEALYSSATYDKFE